MSKKTNSSPASEEKAKEASAAEQNEQTAAQAKPEAEAAKQPEEKKPEDAKQQEASEFEKAQQALAQEHDSYLRLAAEYDNYRKRSQKEKDNLYTEIRSETVEKFLPVYDNLERALAQETQDAAFKKGVEMTMNQLVSVMEKLGVESFGAAGDHFDPQLHNAVMQPQLRPPTDLRGIPAALVSLTSHGAAGMGQPCQRRLIPVPEAIYASRRGR